MSEFKKSRTLQENKENTGSFREALTVQMTDEECAYEEISICELESLKEIERQFLTEKKQLLDTLDQLQSKFNFAYDKRSRLLTKLEKNLASKQKKSTHESNHNLFSIITWGPSWMDGLVFTVMAENDVWAKELVRQWLNSNGRENHRIDKVLGLASQDVRAIVNVGAVLLDI